MTREEAIKYLIKPVATSTEIGEEKQKEFEAYNMAIEALSEPTVIRSRTLMPTKDFKEWAKRIKEVNPNAVVIPCDAEVVSVDSVVRCKDCDRGFGSPVCPIQSQGWAINTDTFYCAWGERR